MAALMLRYHRVSIVRRPGIGVAAVGAALAILSACRKEAVPEPEKALASTPNAAALEPVLMQYADIAFASYSDAASQARALLAVVERFLDAPTEAGLRDARNAWIAARTPYQQTEVFRFYEGPIDRVEMYINTWPIDENYIEASAPGERPGIVQNTVSYPELSAALLTALNAKEGETSISTGFHVLEFLLWGRDTRADGPGDRPYTDFVAPAEEKGKADVPALALRRGRYARLATELLVRQLEEVRDAWQPNRPDNYRAKFLRRPGAEALALVIKGMGSLSGPELAGERLTVAYETKAQENEHSCFSDNTHADIVNDAIGIQNICLGRYGRMSGESLEGPGLCDFLAKQQPELARRLREDVASSVNAAKSIVAPFDRAILGNDSAPGRVAILGTIRALERQTQTLTEIAAAYNVRLAMARPRAVR